MTGVNTENDGTLTPVANETGYHVYHDPTNVASLSETLINAIAAIRNTNPTETPIPLTDSVDSDALDAPFRGYVRRAETGGRLRHVLRFRSGRVRSRERTHIHLRMNHLERQ